LLKAGTLFAVVGYRRATIRDISRLADVNVAMVTSISSGRSASIRRSWSTPFSNP
jgi:hypothetical protein